jgi:hypothetical protein
MILLTICLNRKKADALEHEQHDALTKLDALQRESKISASNLKAFEQDWKMSMATLKEFEASSQSSMTLLEERSQELDRLVRELSVVVMESILSRYPGFRENSQAGHQTLSVSDSGNHTITRVSPLVALAESQSVEINLLLSLRFSDMESRYVRIEDAHRESILTISLNFAFKILHADWEFV